MKTQLPSHGSTVVVVLLVVGSHGPGVVLVLESQ
jgi:hypothetical protein